MNKPLPRVVCSIDGSTLPVQDYSFTSVADGGYHEFRGQAPVRRLLALGADQEAPLTVYHEGTGDVLWDGRFVTDPEMIEGIGLISATGPKAELEKTHGRLLYQTRDYSLFAEISGNPYNYTNNPGQFSVSSTGNSLEWHLIEQLAVNNGENNGFAFWAPGAQITRVTYDWIASFGIDTRFKHEIWKGNGPTAAGTMEMQLSHNGATGGADHIFSSPHYDHILLLFAYRDASPTAIGPGAAFIYRNLRVQGIAPGDSFTVSEVLQDLGGRLGFNTSLIESSSLNVLPLDWRGSWASLASYVTALVDWRWSISTVAVPGTGLVKYLEAGPWEREWTLFKGSSARPNLKPQQRRNEAVITYQDVGGADREVRVRANPDPLAKWGVVRTIEETLADVQPNGDLATAVATTYAQRYSQKVWVGDIDAADARDDSGRGDARLVKPGDIGRLADWGPSEETFHRIHGTEQTQTSVRYSIESPISAAPLTEGAALERARRPSEAELPELEPGEVPPYFLTPEGKKLFPHQIPRPPKPHIITPGGKKL